MLRKHYMDLEADNRESIPDVEKADKPIPCIGIYDNFRKIFVSFVWRDDLGFLEERYEYEGVVRPGTKFEWRVYSFPTEYDMLEAYIDFLIAIDFDHITAWNLYGFDAQYLIKRMEVIGVPRERIRLLSPQNEVYIHREERLGQQVKKWHLTEDIVKIRGRILFDLLPAYRKMHISEMRGFSLYDVTEEEFKVKLERVDGEWWMNDLDRLLRVNISHVEATVALDEKIKIIDFYQSLTHVSGVDFAKVFSNSQILDIYFLMHKPPEILLPTKPKEHFEDETERPGALVLTPEKGIFENVLAFDLSKLYPSIIRSCNMSPETLIEIPIPANSVFENGLSVIKQQLELHRKQSIEWYKANWNTLEGAVAPNRIDERDMLDIMDAHKGFPKTHPFPIFMRYVREHRKLVRAYNKWKLQERTKVQAQHPEWINIPNGVSFRKDFVGFIPRMYDKLFALRKGIEDEIEEGLKSGAVLPKSPMWEDLMRKRQVVKDLVNSVFGYLWFRSSRLYRHDIGRSVTAMGQEILKWTKEFAEGKGFKVKYGDTDSVHIAFASADVVTVEKAVEIGKGLRDSVIPSYDVFAKQFNIESHYFSLDLEYLYGRILFTGARKNYAVWIVWKDGKVADYIDITGMAPKRSDTAKLARDTFTWLVEKLLRNRLTVELVQEITDHIQKLIDDVRHGLFSPMDLGIPKRVAKGLDNYAINSPWIRGAKYANKYLGADFKRGSKPVLVYIKKVLGGRYPPIDVVCIDSEMVLPDEFIIDWEEMVKVDLRAKLESILDAAGITWEDVAWDREQLRLPSFSTAT